MCGDDILNADPGTDEECDDGNTAPLDGCDANCQLECGNGTLEGAEECDDSGESATCDDDCSAAACGDGNQNETAAEWCDDGNTVDGDGCHADCSSDIEPMPTRQQRCVNAVNRNLAGVAKAQGGEVSKCVKDAAAGKVTNALDCLDAGPKTTKAGEKTTKTATGKKCTADNLPHFAFTTDGTVNGAGSDEVLEGTNVILGAAPEIAPKDTDKDGAKCQAEAIKQYNAIVGKWLAEANQAKKSVLEGPPGAGSAAVLATGIDAGVAASTKLDKAVTKAGTGLGKKCEGVPIDPLFDCSGTATDVATLTTCVTTEAQRAACQAFEVADGLDLTCL